MIQVLLVNALFSLVFPLGKIALHYSTPFFTIGLRMLLAGVFLLSFWAWFYEKKELCFSRNILWKISLLAVFNIFLTNAC